VILTFVNCVSVKWVTRIQNFFTAGKVIALIIIICLGAYCLFLGRFENFKAPFEGTTTNPGHIALAFYSGLFSYAGWYIIKLLLIFLSLCTYSYFLFLIKGII
jgi:L-type amino acid transporter 5